MRPDLLDVLIAGAGPDGLAVAARLKGYRNTMTGLLRQVGIDAERVAQTIASHMSR